VSPNRPVQRRFCFHSSCQFSPASCVQDYTTLASLTQRLLPGLRKMLQSSVTPGSCRASSATAGPGCAVRRPAQLLHRHMCLPRVTVLTYFLWRAALPCPGLELIKARRLQGLLGDVRFARAGLPASLSPSCQRSKFLITCFLEAGKALQDWQAASKDKHCKRPCSCQAGEATCMSYFVCRALPQYGYGHGTSSCRP